MARSLSGNEGKNPQSENDDGFFEEVGEIVCVIAIACLSFAVCWLDVRSFQFESKKIVRCEVQLQSKESTLEVNPRSRHQSVSDCQNLANPARLMIDGWVFGDSHLCHQSSPSMPPPSLRLSCGLLKALDTLNTCILSPHFLSSFVPRL